jgi:hypothetical protein
MNPRILPFLAAMLAWPALAADRPAVESLPAAAVPFVEKGTRPIFVGSADLNGDGLQDYLLVLEKEHPDDAERPLLILLAKPNGQLRLAARNDRIISCSTCGGAMGDPFQDPAVEAKSFTVMASGGSAWRWSIAYKFNYSRRDDTWQLVRVEETSFHAAEPDKGKEKISTPPKDFGKIGIDEFDPENWRGRGPK